MYAKFIYSVTHTHAHRQINGRQTDKKHIHTHATHVHMNIDKLAASAIYHQTNAQSLLG